MRRSTTANTNPMRSSSGDLRSPILRNASSDRLHSSMRPKVSSDRRSTTTAKTNPLRSASMPCTGGDDLHVRSSIPRHASASDQLRSSKTSSGTRSSGKARDQRNRHTINVCSGLTKTMPEPKITLHKTLSRLHLPPGLLSSVLQSYRSTNSRLWILDNSSSMSAKDAHLIGGSLTEIRSVDSVSRWNELQECVKFHADMAARCWIPTKFFLVNDPKGTMGGGEEVLPQKFSLCWSDPKSVGCEVADAERIMREVVPDGKACPLAHTLHRLTKAMSKGADNLERKGKRTSVVICTQGLPTDTEGRRSKAALREFYEKLEVLLKLPVRVIFRLCTDDEKVLEVYNGMENKFDSCDVLDDFWGEAYEIYLHNPWLTYGIGLHRLRESGFAPDNSNVLDERPFTLDEIHQFCATLLIGGDGCVNLPHPRNGWEVFARTLRSLLEKEKAQWNPVKQKLMPWIDLGNLEARYGEQEQPRRKTSASQPQQQQRQRQQRGVSTASQQQRCSFKQSCPDISEPPKESPRWSSWGQYPDSPRNPMASRQQRRVRFYDTPSPPKDPPVMTLKDTLKLWSHQPSDYKTYYPLEHLLLTIPDAFPPINAMVEPHDYFGKWKVFDKEAFNEVEGGEMKELLRRAVRKTKFFLHPDKLPKVLTENQTLLFETIWNVIQDRESALECTRERREL